LTRILNQLSSELQTVAELRLGEESIRQICKEYEDVLAAMDEMAKTPGAAMDNRYRMLSDLRENLEEEMIQLLQQQ